MYKRQALDGAGAWKRFSSITLPLLMPTLAPAIVLGTVWTVSYTHLRAHETVLDLVCRLLLEKKKPRQTKDTIAVTTHKAYELM